MAVAARIREAEPRVQRAELTGIGRAAWRLQEK